VTVDVVEKRPFRSGHERRFAADRPERPRRAVTPPGIRRLARTNASWLLGSENSGFEVAGVLRVMVFRRYA
jgi:hypothetical protein